MKNINNKKIIILKIWGILGSVCLFSAVNTNLAEHFEALKKRFFLGYQVLYVQTKG